MPWTCPICSSSINHNDPEPAPRSGVIYRCHVCRTELVADTTTGKLLVVPVPVPYERQL
jgi:hypothetical protein